MAHDQVTSNVFEQHNKTDNEIIRKEKERLRELNQTLIPLDPRDKKIEELERRIIALERDAKRKPGFGEGHEN